MWAFLLPPCTTLLWQRWGITQRQASFILITPNITTITYPSKQSFSHAFSYQVFKYSQADFDSFPNYPRRFTLSYFFILMLDSHTTLPIIVLAPIYFLQTSVPMTPKRDEEVHFFTWPPLNWETFPHIFDWIFLVILQKTIYCFKGPIKLISNDIVFFL